MLRMPKQVKRDRKSLVKNTKAKCGFIVVSAALIFLTMVVTVTIGNYSIPIHDVFDVIIKKITGVPAMDNNYYVLVWEVRLPRIFLSALGGMGLAISGAVFQGVFRNPLVEPYILGVSSGAACGAALSIVFFGSVLPVSFLAFVFAVGAMCIAYSIATRGGQTPLVHLVLAGVIVSSLFAAILNLVKTLAPDSKLREISFWTMGGYYTATWDNVATLIPIVLIGLLLLWTMGWKLNVLSMGEQEARSLGVSINFVKIASLGISTLITASIVSQVGIVSWVGLMIPHATRMVIGADHRYLIPFSAFVGGIFMIICDTMARTFILGEIPISIITSILGAPYLIYLLRTNRQVAFG